MYKNVVDDVQFAAIHAIGGDVVEVDVLDHVL